MQLLRILILAVCAAFLPSCADSFPGSGVLAPETLGGYQMDASGLKGSYYYEFEPEGSYRRVTILPSGNKSAPYHGIWKWERTSPNTATLTLDHELVVSLAFTTREHANARLVNDKRLYPVEFTAPE